jgi:hypothetical protein
MCNSLHSVLSSNYLKRLPTSGIACGTRVELCWLPVEIESSSFDCL